MQYRLSLTASIILTIVLIGPARAEKLQVGAFRSPSNVQSRSQLLQDWGYEVHHQQTAGELTRIRTADLSGQQLARLKKRLKERSIDYIKIGQEPAPVTRSNSDISSDTLPAIISRIKGHRRSLSDTLSRQINKVMGTEYVWGAESPGNGFDCSGLLYWLFDRETPRTVSGMWPWTTHVKRSDLQPGDFVFFTFDSLKEPDHVGLYLGGKTFVHASSTYGVIRADLSKAYYQRNLYGFGRPQF
ncbi:MAG: C40 family peptidase [bacterium]